MGTTFSSSIQKFTQIIGQYPKTINGLAIGLVENLKFHQKYGFYFTLKQLAKDFITGALYSMLEFLYLDTFLSMLANQFKQESWVKCFSQSDNEIKIKITFCFVLIEQIILICGKYAYQRWKQKLHFNEKKKPSILQLLKEQLPIAVSSFLVIFAVPINFKPFFHYCCMKKFYEDLRREVFFEDDKNERKSQEKENNLDNQQNDQFDK